ncbi:MAG: NUDIX hydrolase [Candidatus Zixiibacteriota bacterium]
MSEWKIKNSEYLLKHKYLTVRKDVCETKEGKLVNPYFVLEIAPWVQVLAFDDNNQVLITKQYRHGIQKVIYGLPTGFAEKSDRSPLQAARRELIEETGFDSKKFVKTGELYPNPALQNNRVHCFAAFDIKKVKEPVCDHSERILSEFMSLKRLLNMISDGSFSHALHVAGVFVTLQHFKMLKVT